MSHSHHFTSLLRSFFIGLLFVITTNSLHAQCVAEFTFDTACCPGCQVHFTDLSTSPLSSITTWQWEFGDGGTSGAQNPTHIYTVIGTFNVSLVITTASGCIDTVTHPVPVPDGPLANFTTPPVCEGDSTCFTDLSTSGGGNALISWFWDFGDGNTSTDQQPCHLYNAPGIYNVTLTVCNDLGCCDSTTLPVEIYPNPLADFDAVSDCSYVASFTDQSFANAPGIISWYWDFGDGSGSSTQQNPVYVYPDSGTYLVTLTVVNSNGCSSTTSDSVTANMGAVTDFADSTTCNNTTYFTDLSYAVQPGDSIVAWYWEFGDGDTSTVQNPVHQYNSSANYTVNLTVAVASGCSNSTSSNLFIPNLMVADFTFYTDCDYTTYFTDLSVPTTGDSISNWIWMFGDGSTSTQQDPVHAYTAPGSYTVVLITMCSCGATDTVIHENIIYTTPAAGFTYSPLDPSQGDLVYFTDQSSCPDSSDQIVEWRWYYGDGDSAVIYFPDNPNTEHIYADTGFYAVTLVIIDNDTCTGQITQMVNVNSMIQIWPTADFSHDYTCLNQYIHFTDLSSTNGGTPIVSWSWDFGDGGTSTAQNPQYLYEDTGNYDISLIVTNADNHSDTVIKTLDAYPLPDVSASAVPFTGGVGETIQFYGTSTSSIVSWFWNFDDGTTASVQNPVHIYQQNGLFDVLLLVTDNMGCTNTTTLLVLIYQPAAFPEDSTIWNTLGDNSISGDEWRFRYAMVGDTTIGITDPDTTYAYSKVYSMYDSTLSTQNSNYFAAIRTTEDNKVYVLLPGFDETLLYDYTLEVGDTAWYSIGGALCYDGVGFWEEDHYRVVTAIDTVEVENGDLRRRWTLVGELMGDTWLEGIGSIEWFGLFNPLISDMTLCGDSYSFACMKQGDEVVYLNNPKCDHCFCDLLTVIDDQDQANPHAVKVFPNPLQGTTIIGFDLDRPGRVCVELSDATGNIIKQIPCSSYAAGKQQIRFNSNDLHTGIYLMRISFEGKDAYIVKIVKGR